MGIPATYVIKTKRLLIKQSAEEDLPFVFEATRFKGFNDGMMWDPPDAVDDLRPHLQSTREAWAKGDGYGFSIWSRAEESAFIGRVSIRKNDYGAGWNVGYFTHPAQQGNGYMTEALGGVLRFGFEELQAPSIEAYYATWNTGSGRVLEKAGMKLRSFVRQGFKKNGVWVPEFRVVLMRKDWDTK